jgi:hypothetical protein
MTAKIKDSNDEPYTFYRLLNNILLYKMSVIMYIVSFFVVSDAYAALGGLGAFIAIIACVFIYSFYPNIYQQFKPTDATSTIKLETYKQAHKFCSKKNLPKADCDMEHTQTWFEWLLSWFTFLFPKAEPEPNNANPVVAHAVADSIPSAPSAPPAYKMDVDKNSLPLANANANANTNASVATPVKGGSKRQNNKKQ